MQIHSFVRKDQILTIYNQYSGISNISSNFFQIVDNFFYKLKGAPAQIQQQHPSISTIALLYILVLDTSRKVAGEIRVVWIHDLGRCWVRWRDCMLGQFTCSLLQGKISWAVEVTL